MMAGDLVTLDALFVKPQPPNVVALLLLLDEPRPGAPRQVGDAQIERVVRLTLESTPAAATHWSTRAMARRSGLSQTMIAKQGRHDEAHTMLAEICNWFTEGFDTADLIDAKVLLAELGA